MSLRSIVKAWNEFFFTPQSPTPVALFRVLYGVLVIAELILLRPDWLTWYSPRGVLSLETMHLMEPGTRINLFSVLPLTDGSALAIYWILLAAAVLLTLGLLTRFSSIAVFVCLASIHERNIYILNSGDTMLRVAGFFLMFAPAGAAFSLDRLWRVWRGREGPEVPLRLPWAQRMIQVETALLYFFTFWNKSLGPAWVNGTALHYVYHLDQFHRFPVPAWLQDPFMVKLQTWFTLAAEFSLGVLVWIRELRYPVLLVGIVLHLSLEYTMNVPLFQWIVLATYVTFVDPADLERAWNWIRRRVAIHLPASVTVVYDGNSPQGLRTANLLRTLDIFGCLTLVDHPGEAQRSVLVMTPAGPRSGWAGISYAARVIPALWPLGLRWLFAGQKSAAWDAAVARK